MQPPIRLVIVVSLMALLFSLTAATAAAEAELLEEGAVKAYLEKKAVGDTGSCYADDTRIEIIGISDLVPGHQAEVFYTYAYTLRCNRGTESKNGRGVLKAVRLRDGGWMDRETYAPITK